MHRIFSRNQKKMLGEFLAEFYMEFGKVATRRDYRDDEDEGGSGGAVLIMPHPLFSDVPPGASPDLTFMANENKFSETAMDKNSDKLTSQLKKAYEYKKTLTNQAKESPKATML